MKIFTCAALAAIVLLSGCAARRPLLTPGTEPGTTLSDKQFEVGYSLATTKMVGVKGVHVAIDIKNISKGTVMVVPSVALLSNTNKLLGLPSLETVLSRAAMRAQRPVPDSFYTAPGGYYSIRGTATDVATGRSYNVQGTATQASSFASGYAQGAAIAAAMDRNEAEDTFTWASANWLRASYELPPGVSVVGEVFMPFYDKEFPTQTSYLVVTLGGAKKTIGAGEFKIAVDDRAEVKFAVPESRFK
jgi:hypothetical protein